MPRLSHQALRRAASTHARAATLAALLPLIGATALSSPAKAAPPVVSCQAINATSIVSGNIPGGNCTNAVQPGDTFELDFSDVFAANGGSLPLNKFYSLQVANLNTGPSNTLSFSNVEFLVTGAGPGGSFSDTPITIWTTSTPTFPFAQGLGSYSTSGTSNVFNTVPVRSQASFTLTGPVAPSALGIAALINTTAVNLSTAGITSFTGAKIRGTFSGSSSNFSGFSAGLALFDSDPNMGMVTPSTVYGNAFNVPGPLPVVGAGAAFGWSRRLRQRVRKAKASAATSLV